MRWLLSVLAVLGLAGVLPLSAPGVAHACSCVYEPDGPRIVEQVSYAASVFTGTATAKRVEDQTEFYEFDVREVFEGDVGAETVVSSSVQSAACGRGFDIGTEYLVFTSTYDTKGAPWSVDSCSATTESRNNRTRDAAVTVYGAPLAIDPQDQVFVFIDDGGEGAGDAAGASWWWRLAFAGGAVVIAGALVRRWIRSRR
ncbi:hypothetical protein [Rhodococcus maanshanensis]|uniref:Tissue inhibitor of metalloproteinase n=1 Tax=Rhodococcus maanshanensis TaxID=183556 RepID=A0A1H7V480_9NOCA|nr:hypothetical protein [Rhodococcus maanshanensis]SEM03973.1 hypothetical protein SAMN05444583_12082 [Rhodococcus maanshanensis]